MNLRECRMHSLRTGMARRIISPVGRCAVFSLGLLHVPTAKECSLENTGR